MIVKCNGLEVEKEIFEYDVVMYNGVCYQIITQVIMNGDLMGAYHPKITKSEAEQLISQNVLTKFYSRNIEELKLDYYRLKTK
jgi:hypothetical protein